MTADSDVIRQLLEQLAKDRQTLIDGTNKTNELLQQTLNALKSISDPPPNAPQLPHQQIGSLLPLHTPWTGFMSPDIQLTNAAQRVTTADIEVESVPRDRALSTITGDSDDSDSEESDSRFVQVPLQPEQYDMDGFRKHVLEYPWSEGGKAILCGLDDDYVEMQKEFILPMTEAEAELDRSHLCHYSIYDIGPDGVPVDARHSGDKNPTRAMQIWNRIRTTNARTDQNKAVGRIVIVREPSPKVFAALHYTMHKHFDVDEMFDLLKHEDPGLMFPHRAFDDDDRHRRSFVITMEYFTIIGERCKPMAWQTSDEQETEKTDSHVPISRCSSIIALSFEGPPMSKVKNRDRRMQRRYGDVFDPFSPWRVLSIQAYPDWHATTDTHKSTNSYLNGPEAFLHTVRAEFADARKRLKEVYTRVGDLVEPPSNFIFNHGVRDALLFEDDNFTYSKRYFWAYQTLSIINQDINEMIESYRDSFRDSVWDGTNKIIWPGESTASSRYQQWRKHMAKLRRTIEDEVEGLEYIKTMNSKRMQDIEALRDNLFSGTSVMESRRSVEQTLVTVEQNRSVLLLTLITIFFLPLTFVTSVFGMTNMDPSESYQHFGWVLVAICIPTYIFIGSMHTDAGLNFWTSLKNDTLSKLGHLLARSLAVFGYVPKWAKIYDPQYINGQNKANANNHPRPRSKRANSATRLAMNMRMRQTTDTASDAGILSRINSRDRERDRFTIATPRPQPTSGDRPIISPTQSGSHHHHDYNSSRQGGGGGGGHTGVVRHVRTRSNEVTFSIDKTARVHGLLSPKDKEKDTDVESVSPRTNSPVHGEVKTEGEGGGGGGGGGDRKGDMIQVIQNRGRQGATFTPETREARVRSDGLFSRLWRGRRTGEHAKMHV